MECPACETVNDETAESCFKCGKGFSLTEGALLASRYEILSFLGRGGMGIVYRAHDRALDEMVALKVLRFDIARAQDVARRFRSEIKLARKVRHPNVCGIHEYGEDGIYRFIVMELIEGWDLRQILRDQGAFSPEEACALIIEITEGLEAIHAVGIVHRDLKSPNIMLDVQGRVRLMDFGIAKQYGVNVTSGSATATGLVLGTPEYMSPEQARGQKIDYRSDVYALGVIAYELFTGHVPFKGETPLETIFKHLQEVPVFTGPTAAPGIPEPVIPVLRQALAKAPDDRYATAHDMSRALRQARAAAFGVSPSGAMPPVLTRTASIEQERPDFTQTIPTPTPPRSPGEAATKRPPPPTMVTPSAHTPPPARPPSAPAAPPPLPGQTQPAPAPTRLVAPPSGTSRVVTAGRTGRRSWIVAGSVTATVAVAGLLWLGSAVRSREAPPASAPTREAPVPPPELAPGPAGATPASRPAAALPGVDGPATPALEDAAPVAGPEVGVAAAPARAPVRERPVEVEPKRANRGDRGTAPAAPVAPAPTPTPTPPPPTPTPPPPPPQSSPPVVAYGQLQLLILPWAEVTVDGEERGTTPMTPLSLEAGEHRVVFTHPSYKPLQRSVVIRADETTTLEIDLSYEAFPR